MVKSWIDVYIHLTSAKFDVKACSNCRAIPLTSATPSLFITFLSFMVNRWGHSGNGDRFYFLGGPKITADGTFSHEIKRCLLPGRKVMTNLDSLLKSRAITLPTKIRLVKTMAFPVVMYGCENWTIKKAECRRIGAFEL